MCLLTQVELSIGKFLYVLGTTAAITGAVALYAPRLAFTRETCP